MTVASGEQQGEPGRKRTEPPLRSLVVAVPDFDPSVGGTSTQARLLARELARRGHGVTVITRRRAGLPRREQASAVAVRRVGAARSGRLAGKVTAVALALALHRARPRVLLTVQWTDAVVAAWLARRTRATIVVWGALGDAADAVRGKSPLGRLRRRLLGAVRHVVLTEAMAAELERLHLPQPEVIPVPLDRAHFRPPSQAERAAARKALSLEEEFAVLYVGHLRALKRVDALVDAFALLARDVDARLLLVGGSRGADDDVEDALRAQVAQLELEERVVFAGVRSDPREAYWGADAFVLPSTREGLPNTLVEALACGVPSIAPKSAAGDSVLADGAGVVTETNRPEDLLVALRTLAGDAARRTELAAGGPAHAARYDIQSVADAYERLIREVA